MAARYSVSTGKVGSTALAAAGKLTLVLLNPVTYEIAIPELWISCGSVSAQSDIAMDFYRVVTIGSAAGATGTVVKENPNSAATAMTALTTLTTEPTTVEILRSLYFPVNQNWSVIPFPLGREPVAAAAGQRIGLRIFNDEAGAMTAVNLRAVLVTEE